MQQLLDGQAVDQIIRDVREIIDAIGEGHRLLPVFLFEFLFDAGVQEADVGRGGDDGLAFQFENDAQHTVGRRVLGPMFSVMRRGAEGVAGISWTAGIVAV